MPLVSTPEHSTNPDPHFPETLAALDEEGRQEVDRLAALFPDDANALEVKARVYFLLGQTQVAAASWQQILEIDPDYAYAHSGLGLVAAKNGQYEEAASRQGRAIELMPGLREASYQLSDVQLKLGEVEAAIDTLKQLISNGGDTTTSYVRLGQAYLAAKEYEKARDALQTALARYAEIPRAQFGLATALRRLGDTQEAAQAMQRYQELRVKDNEVYDDFRTRVNSLSARSIDFAERYVWASRVYLTHGRADEARRLSRRAAQLDPANTESRILLASLYQQTGRAEDALAMCQELVEIEPNNVAYQLNLGIMARNLRRFASAELAFLEVARLAPEKGLGFAGLAKLYLVAGRKMEEAVPYARRAVELDPIGANLALLSQVLAATGDRTGAVEAIEKAIRLEPENTQYIEVQARLRMSPAKQ